MPLPFFQTRRGQLEDCFRFNQAAAGAVFWAGGVKGPGVIGQIRLQAANIFLIGRSVPGLGCGQKNSQRGHAKASGQMHGAGIIGNKHLGREQRGREAWQIRSPNQINKGRFRGRCVFAGQMRLVFGPKQQGHKAKALPEQIAQTGEVTAGPTPAIVAGAQLKSRKTFKRGQ